MNGGLRAASVDKYTLLRETGFFWIVGCRGSEKKIRKEPCIFHSEAEVQAYLEGRKVAALATAERSVERLMKPIEVPVSEIPAKHGDKSEPQEIIV